MSSINFDGLSRLLSKYSNPRFTLSAEQDSIIYDNTLLFYEHFVKDSEENKFYYTQIESIRIPKIELLKKAAAEYRNEPMICQFTLVSKLDILPVSYDLAEYQDWSPMLVLLSRFKIRQ